MLLAINTGTLFFQKGFDEAVPGELNVGTTDSEAEIEGDGEEEERDELEARWEVRESGDAFDQFLLDISYINS